MLHKNILRFSIIVIIIIIIIHQMDQIKNHFLKVKLIPCSDALQTFGRYEKSKAAQLLVLVRYS